MSTSKRKLSGTLTDEERASDHSGEPPTDSRPLKTPRHQSPAEDPTTGDGSAPSRSNPRPPPHTLSYPDVKQHNARQTPFQLPTQIASYSHDEHHAQRFDNSAMRYYVDPPLGARLDYGYDRWIRKPDERGRLDGLLNAIREVKKDATKAGAVPDNGVVSWRGIMTKILTAPYEERDGWDLNIMCVNGTLYFEEHLTDRRLQEKNDMAPRQRQQTYYGYAFESYCTSDAPTRQQQPGVPSGWGGDVNTNVQWCSVVRTKLGDTRIVIGGEVDCVRGRYTGRTDTFVELKTSMAIRGQNDEARFEKKLLKFYFQSFLLGVPEIVVGFRTPSGVITTTQTFKTIEIPRQVRGKAGAWNPLICLEWGDKFLKTVKDVVQTAADSANASRNVWRATFVPGTGVTVRLLDQTEVDEVVNMEDRIGFLPRSYWSSEVQAQPAQPGGRPVTDSDSDARRAQRPPETAPPPATHRGWQI
ncbi:RAI1 like PD-XK nuclease-domain-containing protein [Ephemerocybe angulata]|uniref:Decapping nuclease n=1 Tax=Ephemerocybe angulata TaxID=980116 RepID=A0A8H6HZA7_9AGAR|nr:RAI1 like PD-XK nuclease-domain-containing protein [Tulosesus angulatus]